ncbi:cytochrome b [Mongoliimonas terrestris]|uniref:cytochrome b n=1 Tax=Mongoliimonas terrestris TaxID=1709001 RepID=UPI000949A199|nr:cytochrome b/b6 domain-containing protein [Mongoliimonas terrestris]
MAWKSTSDSYGGVGIALHWIVAVLFVGMMVAGFAASSATDDSAKVAILSLHAPIGFAILVLTVARIVWWTWADRKPAAPSTVARWQSRVATAVHVGLMGAVLGLALSGIALFALSGAGAIVFGGDPQTLPDFWTFAPRYGHAVLARLAILLVALHVAAALYHQFVLKDHLLARMGVGR